MEHEVEVILTTLMNKEAEILDIEFDAEGHILGIINIREKNWHLAPYTLPDPNSRTLLYKLSKWIEGRCIPITRERIQHLQIKAQVGDPVSLSLKAHALSLSDQYWIRFDSSEKWEDINFFTNSFSDDVGAFLIEGRDPGPDRWDWRTPSSTLNGIMPKGWNMRDDVRILVKGKAGRSDNNQSFREVFASLMFSQVLAPNEFVMYSLLDTGKGSPLSCCDNFITEDTEYLPVHSILARENKLKTFLSYQQLKDMYGENHHVLDWMLLIDCILVNTDRHLNNFGFIRSALTGEILRPAPIFDTGSSLFHELDLGESIQYIQSKSLLPLEGDWDTRYRDINFSRYKEGFLKLLCNYERLFHSSFRTCKFYTSPEHGDRWKAEILTILKLNIEHLLAKC